jgi:hypothetical protein
MTVLCGCAGDGPTDNIFVAINTGFRDFLGINKGERP